jgi:hypothetical protein
MKRKYGAGLKRETLAEEMMRKAAQAKKTGRYNFGTKTKKGSATRGKRRGLAFKAGYQR